MAECPQCNTDIDYLEVIRELSQEAVMDADEHDLNVITAKIIDIKCYCPACWSLLFIHQDDARYFLTEPANPLLTERPSFPESVKGGHD